ncbi:ABC transporter permease (plasmid) [Deinococcus metallilatus]|uniref:ABC transporter permease n=1 Tax=Deinococcus metallilatus TaxID=1211322 RepID=A0AAJ5JZP3_9DEIO|nr:nickel transporter permease [Deinococcus metallilatus]MBB5295694.1 peptide/nickel transport system permease protein [Deinococcus metallilatus]QBY06856.1 ABC transporter permease [Deinococcus metallilatus]TLK32245.1 ABC transporter permease [Deinococcus metallilatus]GMA14226.1 glutathione ABC transporter permease GsiD [Deinococcus metallilatus]
MQQAPLVSTAPRVRRPRLGKPVRRFLQNRLAVIGAVLLLVFGLLALFAPWVSPYDPAQVFFTDLRSPPSAQHLFGTDELGRDILSRVLYGARVSLSAALVSVVGALVAGTVLGLMAGYLRGWVDEVIMRVVDAMLALPFLVLAIALAAMLGPSLQNTMIAIAIVTTPAFARITRGEVLAQREREYVQAAQALGASDPRLVFRHLLPNISGALIVQTSLAIAGAVLAESSLSFLGLGVQPPAPSWGSMLNAARGFLADAPWMSVFPGLAIFLTVLAFNLVGDGLREAIDPRSR